MSESIAMKLADRNLVLVREKFYGYQLEIDESIFIIDLKLIITIEFDVITSIVGLTTYNAKIICIKKIVVPVVYQTIIWGERRCKSILMISLANVRNNLNKGVYICHIYSTNRNKKANY